MNLKVTFTAIILVVVGAVVTGASVMVQPAVVSDSDNSGRDGTPGGSGTSGPRTE